MSELLFSLNMLSNEDKCYSPIDVEKRFKQIDSERQSQDKIQRKILTKRYADQEASLIQQHLGQDKLLTKKYPKFKSLSKSNIYEVYSRLETSSMSKNRLSIETVEELINNIKDNENYLSANEIQNKLDAILCEMKILTSEVKILENKLSHYRNNTQKAVSAHVNKAERFALTVRDEISAAEKECVEVLGIQPTSRNIAHILNQKNVPTPTEKGIWYDSTVRLVKGRIQSLEQPNHQNISR